MTVEELEIIVSAKIEQVKPQIQKVVQEIKSAVKETDGIGTDLLGKINTSQVTNELQKVKKQVKEMFDPNDVSGMKINGKSIIQGFSSAYGTLKGSTDNLNNVLESYRNKLKNVGTIAETTKKKVADVGYVKYDTAPIQKMADNYKKAEKEAEKTKEQIKKSTTNGNKLSGSVQQVKKHLSGAGNGAKVISNGLSKARSMASYITSHLKVGLGQILKIAGSLIGLRAIYSGLRSVANSWLSSQNTQAQQLQANLDYMKYALGSSLQPVIETIVNLIYQAMKGVQSLVYALTGVNIFANASAKAYANMASGAKDAQKATQGLADIDEIHNIQQDSSSSGGGSGSGVTPNFDLSGIETADWAQKLIDNIKNGNWYEIGATVGNKINQTLSNIPWDEIKNTAGNIGRNLGQFINGGVANTKWELVGKTAAEGVNTAFRFLKNFLEITDFKSVGEAAGRTINGFFDNVEWETVGETLSEGVKGALDVMLGAIQKFDRSKLSNAFKEMFKNIDWSGIWDRVLELLVYAGIQMLGIPRFIKIAKGIIEGIKGAIETIEGKIRENGGNIVQGLIEGMLDGLVNIGRWIKEHIFEPIIKGIKDAFGIHSPSTVMKEQGGYIIEGLKNGIEEKIEDVKKAFGKVKDVIIEVLGKAWLKVIEGAQGVVNFFIRGFNKVIDMLNNLSIDLPEWMGGPIGFDIDTIDEVDWVDEYKKKWEEAEEITEEKSGKIKSLISTNFNIAAENARTATSGMVKDTEGNFKTVSTSPMIKKAKDTMESYIEALDKSGIAKTWGFNLSKNYSNGINSQQSTLKTVVNNVKSTVSSYLNQGGTSKTWGTNLIDKFKDGINKKNKAKDFKTSLNTALNTAKSYLDAGRTAYVWGEDMMKGFINGINALKNKISKTVQSVAKSISSFLHFSRPDEGPLRDYETWMPDMIDGLSSSLLKSAPVLDNAVSQVSENIADNLRMATSGLEINSNINKNITSSGMGSQLENAVYSAIQKAESLFRLTINNELKLNTKTIAKEIIDDLNDEARRRGYKPILQH